MNRTMSKSNKAKREKLKMAQHGNKIGYDSAHAAAVALNAIVIKTGRCDLHYYKCSFCSKWHVGH